MAKYLVVGLVFFLSGCTAATLGGNEEMYRLQYTVARINKETKESLEKIEKKQVSLENKISVLKEDIDAFQKEVDSRREVVTEMPPEASEQQEGSSSEEKSQELFNIARNDYLQGQYSLAIMGFKEYLRLYPGGGQAAEAQYWLAESFFSQEDFKSAVEEFDQVIKGYPENQWVAPALYKKALGLVKEDRTSEAVLILDEIIERFPQSNESKLAQELKKDLEIEIPKSE